ncbi:MAG: hypothetical protein RLZZ301_676 [Bacteroidota bacterium]
MGNTWSSNDVKYVKSFGYGFTLGRSFNYDYGHAIGFDLRGRFLTGQWYGQDTSFSHLTSTSNPLLSSYLVGDSMYLHNYRNDNKELNLELVLHANRLRERTGLDPYIFGGLGLTWHQTWTDLGDTLGAYDYNSIYALGEGSSFKGDSFYETRIDGAQGNEWQVNWMPSLGFGLSYQAGRFSFGIEHKTTFTMTDTYEGLLASTPRARNDWYHYTSGVIQFHFKGGNSSSSKPPRQETKPATTVSDINNYTQNCPKPLLSIVSMPSASVSTATSTLEIDVVNITSNSQLSCVNQLNQPITIVPSNRPNRYTILLPLQIGTNVFTINATNSCGGSTQSISISRVECQLPAVSWSNPTQNGSTVQQASFLISAVVSGQVNTASIAVFHNGIPVGGCNFNPTNGLLQRNITLVPGTNTFRIEASNDCGTASQQFTINYNDCVPPHVQITQPSAAGTTTNVASFQLQGSYSGTQANAQVFVYHNNVLINGASVIGNQISANLTLTPGLNNFQIRVTNPCGTDQISSTNYYQNCNAPQITISQPLANAVLTNSAQRIRASITNISTQTGIKVLLNGIETSAFSFNPLSHLLELNTTLVAGLNTLTIMATNDCGSDVETISFTYDNCVAPTVVISSPATTTTNSQFHLTALLTNMPTSIGLSVTQNGQNIPFTYFNGQLQAMVSLLPGLNTFVVTAVRSCGTASKTINVTYNDCTAPQISLIQPSASGSATSATSLEFSAAVANLGSSQNIHITCNGVAVPASLQNGIVTASIQLSNGSNTLVLTAVNACGQDTETLIVNSVQCTAPQITLLNAVGNGSTLTTSNFALSALIAPQVNANQIQLKLNGVTMPVVFANNQLNAQLTLQPGGNSIVLSVSNDCGTDIEQLNLIFDNCSAPQITATQPASNANSTTAQLQLSALVSNIASANQLSLLQNGAAIPFTYSAGILNATVQLQAGSTTFALSASNTCGSDTYVWDFGYQPCQTPSLNISQPATNGLVVNQANYTLQASLTNVAASEISVSVNGLVVSNFNYQNGQLSAPLSLHEGLNSIQIHANTPCGNVNEIVSVNYENCQSPVLTFSSASGSVATPTYVLTATVAHMDNNQGINLTLNNVIVPFTFQNGQLSATLTLQNGTNTISLSAMNNCGSAQQNLELNYTAPCVSPSIDITNPVPGLIGVSNPNVFLQATVTEILMVSQISVLLDGVSQPGATLYGNQLTVPLTLQSGVNTITIIATNTCGTDQEVREIRYEPCALPQVIYNMDSSGSSTNNSIFTYSATIINYTSNMTVSLSMNGTVLTGYSNANGTITAEVSLNVGQNTLVLTVTSDCGTTVATYLVSYDGTGGSELNKRPTGQQAPSRTNQFSTPTPPAPRPSNPTPRPSNPTPTSPTPRPSAPSTPAPKPTPRPSNPAPTSPTPRPSAPSTPAPKPTPRPSAPSTPAPKPTPSTSPAPKPSAPSTPTNTSKGGGR